MRKLVIADEEMMEIAVQQEIQRSEESRYDHRLHGILLVAQGFDCYEVADMFGQNRSTVHRWVKQFNEKGFAGLQEGERPGRPRSVSERQWKTLGSDLRKSPRDFGYEQNLWDGKLLSYHLEHKYGITIKVRQCQRIFRQMGFRRRKPRPVIAKADPTAQAAYKKTPAARPQRKH
jgi:transposase